MDGIFKLSLGQLGGFRARAPGNRGLAACKTLASKLGLQHKAFRSREDPWVSVKW